MAGRRRYDLGASATASTSPTGVLGLELTAKVVPYWAAAAGLFHPCIHPSLGVGPTLGEAAFSAEGIPEGADS